MTSGTEKKAAQCSCILANGRRCRNEAWREIRVRHRLDMPRIGTNVFWVNVCRTHFFASEAKAIIHLTGREDWRNL